MQIRVFRNYNTSFAIISNTVFDRSILIELAFITDDDVVKSIYFMAIYNKDFALYNTANNLKPNGVKVWESTNTPIWLSL